jgi:hypothetical protein
LELSIKEYFISEIRDMSNTTVLVQLFEFYQLLKKTAIDNSPISPILSMAGCLEDGEAEAMRQLFQTEFQQIEGEW